MLKHFFTGEPTVRVDSHIDVLLEQMQKLGPDSPEYPTMLAYLERLNELKAKERRSPVSRDTIAIIAGNLLGILLIVAYEQKHVMTSKAFGQIIKPKSTQ